MAAVDHFEYEYTCVYEALDSNNEIIISIGYDDTGQVVVDIPGDNRDVVVRLEPYVAREVIAALNISMSEV